MKKSKMITKLKKNEIFVFGSNAEGNHAGGAAKLAKEKFGAEQGVARGVTGQCYAIDTMSGIEVIKEQIQPFVTYAKMLSRMNFLVTEIGCGIAGYTVEEIAPLFKKALGVKNIILPPSFLEVLNKPVVYGFKGYDKDLKCRNFQYEIGKEFEHTGEVSHCSSGFHFVKNPLDIFKYYPPKNGNRFTEVTGTGEISEDTKDTKIAVSKLKIGVEVNLKSIIETGVTFIFEKVKATKDLKEASSGYASTSASSGNYSTSASSGNSSTSASSGNYSTSASSGNYSTSASSGNYSTSASSGNYSTSASSGYASTSASSGDSSRAKVTGKNSIAVANGVQSKVSGVIGSYIIGSEYKDGVLIDVQVAKVDGKKIKENTWYQLKKGKFVIAD